MYLFSIPTTLDDEHTTVSLLPRTVTRSFPIGVGQEEIDEAPLQNLCNFPEAHKDTRPRGALYLQLVPEEVVIPPEVFND